MRLKKQDSQISRTCGPEEQDSRGRLRALTLFGFSLRSNLPSERLCLSAAHRARVERRQLFYFIFDLRSIDFWNMLRIFF